MSAAQTENEPRQDWLELIAGWVASLRFGVIQMVVHDSQVVQIERTEKNRLNAPAVADKRP